MSLFVLNVVFPIKYIKHESSDFITQQIFHPHVSTLLLIFIFPPWELLKQQFDWTIIEGVVTPLSCRIFYQKMYIQFLQFEWNS